MNIPKIFITGMLSALCGVAVGVVPDQNVISPTHCKANLTTAHTAPQPEPVLTVSAAPIPTVISRTVTLDPVLLERNSSNFDALLRHVRLIPHERNGEVDGFRLDVKKRVSLLTTLGIEDGDIIHSINGKALGAGDPAVGNIQDLYPENHFVISLTRNGRKHLLQYEIR